ncbi:tellurite resistance TerB family protein [Psychroflexus salis]|uniref:Molecular chaperone DnaJ n=1 Tax=Psychroflexus salis TaxID=1526574 RepID=A0A917EC02_9FLAO|nr:TerB family tellurite resistance protein [Psychroflexus salis]GGE22317.1 molecular chaperone DnaJ [Psychroflexus salis]
MFKLVGIVAGFLVFKGFFGAFIGFFIGSAIDRLLGTKVQFQTSSFGDRSRNVSPGDFELNLLSLASIVIKADGKTTQQELDFVRQYFVQAYGKERANATFRTFNQVVKKREVSAERICDFIRPRLSYEVRLQVLHFLFNIGQADGRVSDAELNVIMRIARNLRINKYDFESIKAMFFKSADNAYKILEIDKSASNDEVKKAYRKMAKKYHPDKLQHMDEAYQKGAQEKFTKVQEAYEQIQKERGI